MIDLSRFDQAIARMTSEEMRLAQHNAEDLSARGLLRGLRRLRQKMPLSDAMLEYIDLMEERYGRELDERDARRALEDYD